MKQISRHISFKEATHSYTANRYGIDNTPDDRTLQIMRHTANCIFEPVREYFGEPIRINSFYRSRKLNRKVGGSRTSQHIKGEAMDLDDTYMIHYKNRDIFWFIKNHLDFDQLIWEFGTDKNPDWVHVSCKPDIRKNRHQALRSFRRNGKIVYEPFA